MDGPTIFGIGFKASRCSEVAAFVMIDEEMEVGNAFRNGHQAEPLIAQCCPAWDASERFGRQSAFNAFGETKPAVFWCKQPNCGFA